MDERCDYVQKFLAEWELQNKLFEIVKSNPIYQKILNHLSLESLKKEEGGLRNE